MSDKYPYMQWYPADWRKDPAVQSLTYEERGIWFEILMIMYECDQRGRLGLNGNPMDAESLANVLGLNEAKVQQTLSRLVSKGVASYDDQKYLVNRRMIRDERYRQNKVKAGREGGIRSASRRSSKCQANFNTSDTDTDTNTYKTTTTNTAASASLPPFLDQTTWQDYLAMRKVKRCPTTSRAIHLIFQKLKKLLESGNDPNAVLEQSIVRGWTGVFPLADSDKFSKSNYNPSVNDEKTLTTFVPFGDHPDKDDPKPLPHYKLIPKLKQPKPPPKKILSLLEIKTLPIPPDSQQKKVEELKKIEEIQKKGY